MAATWELARQREAMVFCAGFLSACVLGTALIVAFAPHAHLPTMDSTGGRSLNLKRRLGVASCPSIDATHAFARANTEKSDKVKRHAYHLMYAPFFAPYLHRPVRVLEIGVQNGASLSLWQRLFPNNLGITGITFGTGSQGGGWVPASGVLKKREATATLYHGDQSNATFLWAVQKDLKGQKFDVIIDDGSHVPSHQISTLGLLFDQWLASDGIYVIEDIETSYWDAPKGGTIYNHYRIKSGIGTKGSAIEKLKQVIDVINRKYVLDPNYSVIHGDHSIASLSFSQNCVVLIKKDHSKWATASANAVGLGHLGEAYVSDRLDKERRIYKEYRKTHDFEVAPPVVI